MVAYVWHGNVNSRHFVVASGFWVAMFHVVMFQTQNVGSLRSRLQRESCQVIYK